MKVAFTGCRHIDITPTLIIGYVAEGTIVLVGDCPTGVDRCIRDWCAEEGILPIEYKARWGEFGDGAGPERNGRMVADADWLIAFWDGKSRGTLDCITRATRKGVGVTIHPIAPDLGEQLPFMELP